MRIAALCAVILILVPCSAYAQDQPQSHASDVCMFLKRGQMQGRIPDDVELQIIIATGEGKPDICSIQSFPESMTRQEKIDACTAEENAFLSHKFSKSIDSKVQSATCVVPQNIKEDDT